jgi:hypothetical protein
MGERPGRRDTSMAVTAEELRELRRKKPFQPFRVYTTTGEVFDVLDMINILVGESFVSLTVRKDPNDLYGDYSAYFDYDQLLRVEPLERSPASPGGKS